MICYTRYALHVIPYWNLRFALNIANKVLKGKHLDRVYWSGRWRRAVLEKNLHG